MKHECCIGWCYNETILKYCTFCCNKYNLSNKELKRCLTDHCNEQTHSKYCKSCQSKLTMKGIYNEHNIQVSSSPCGCLIVSIIKPIINIDKLRCHRVFHNNSTNNYTNKEIKSISHWNEVWDACRGWHDGIKTLKFKGKLKRGIMINDGNGIHAVVVSSNNIMYSINGGWG
jgi:hypothetical protein